MRRYSQRLQPGLSLPESFGVNRAASLGSSKNRLPGTAGIIDSNGVGAGGITGRRTAGVASRRSLIQGTITKRLACPPAKIIVCRLLGRALGYHLPVGYHRPVFRARAPGCHRLVCHDHPLCCDRALGYHRPVGRLPVR
jgi:hypothetical protein